MLEQQYTTYDTPYDISTFLFCTHLFALALVHTVFLSVVFFSLCILCFHLFRHIRLDLMYRSCIDSQGLIKNHLPTEIKFQVLLRYDNWNESFCMRPVRAMFECWLLINVVYWIVAEAIQTSIVSIIRCTIWYHCGQHNVMRTANLKIKKPLLFLNGEKRGTIFTYVLYIACRPN